MHLQNEAVIFWREVTSETGSCFARIWIAFQIQQILSFWGSPLWNEMQVFFQKDCLPGDQTVSLKLPSSYMISHNFMPIRTGLGVKLLILTAFYDNCHVYFPTIWASHEEMGHLERHRLTCMSTKSGRSFHSHHEESSASRLVKQSSVKVQIILHGCADRCDFQCS